MRAASDHFTAGDELLERAKKVAQSIKEKIRKLTDEPAANDTKTSVRPLDPTDEAPPISGSESS